MHKNLLKGGQHVCLSLPSLPVSSRRSPELIAPASDQLLVKPVDAGALALDLLKMFLHFLPPLRLKYDKTTTR